MSSNTSKQFWLCQVRKVGNNLNVVDHNLVWHVLSIGRNDLELEKIATNRIFNNTQLMFAESIFSELIISMC